jgi:hypothetical protein
VSGQDVLDYAEPAPAVPLSAVLLVPAALLTLVQVFLVATRFAKE